ncbi:MAG: hypothetical protein GY929_19960 [Actinomycetia bacterium]|nr:hypothetical protein [Actinomycetes bacterium]
MTAMLGVGLLAGCSSDARDKVSDAIGDAAPGEGEPEPPDEGEPEPPDEGEPEPEPEPEPEDDDGLSAEDWLLLAILGVGGFAIIMAGTSLASRHSEQKASARRVRNRRLAEIVGTGRWIHDQGSVDLLRATSAEQLRMLWAGTRERIMESERAVAVMATEETDESLALSLDEAGRALVGLRGAAESYVSVKLGPSTEATGALLSAATQTLYERRRQLESALRPIEAARR